MIISYLNQAQSSTEAYIYQKKSVITKNSMWLHSDSDKNDKLIR